MALITCPECQKEVSDQASACPHCGAPLTTKKRKSRWPAVLVVLVVLFAGFLALGASESAKQRATTSTDGLTERSEFHMKLIHKKPSEVRALIGAPDYTQSTSGGDYWYYNRKTYDFHTGKPDHSAQVVFDIMGVRTVNFN